MEIRLLNADEIECRVQSAKKTGKGVGCILLLYKDARCDMKILDEVFGPLGWEREHQLINGNLFCTVRVWDAEKKMWISKQDVGTESNTEKEKGQASDSFKRACFNLGIGRELYSSPFIWVNLKEGEYTEIDDKGKKKYQVNTFTKFQVKAIGYNDKKEISFLEIADSKGEVRYKLGAKTPATKKDKPTNKEDEPTKLTDEEVKKIIDIGKSKGFTLAQIKKAVVKDYSKTEIADLTKVEYDQLYARLENAAKGA